MSNRPSNLPVHILRNKQKVQPIPHNSLAWHIRPDHQKNDRLIVLLSASVPHIIYPASDEIDADHVFCTQLEVDDNEILTGRPEGPVCIGKHGKYLTERLARSRSNCKGVRLAYLYPQSLGRNREQHT